MSAQRGASASSRRRLQRCVQMVPDLVKEHAADDKVPQNLDSVEWSGELLDDLVDNELDPGRLSFHARCARSAYCVQEDRSSPLCVCPFESVSAQRRHHPRPYSRFIRDSLEGRRVHAVVKLPVPQG